MIETSDVEYMFKYNNKHWNRHSRSSQFMLCRALGFNVQNSRRMRDWTLSHIAKLSETKIIKGDLK